MKKIFNIICIISLIFALSSCGSSSANSISSEPNSTSLSDSDIAYDTPDPGHGNVLVAYFSCTGTTADTAKIIAHNTNAELFEIVPKIPYTEDDLKYYTDCRADREQNDPTCRPDISGIVSDIEGYDIIFIGYPIWHGKAPKIIYSFIESYDLSGKTIVPFCTSGSSGIGGSLPDLKKSAPNSIWKNGARFAGGSSENEISAWLNSLDLNISPKS